MKPATKNMDVSNTIPSFLWQVIKPYKLWYLLMLQEPIFRALYNVINMYALKLIVDAFNNGPATYANLFYPAALYIGSNYCYGINANCE